MALVGLTVVFAAAQVLQPDEPKLNGKERPFWDRPETNHRLAAILKRSCGDCHSNETNWPWYAKLSPGSWMMARHVAGGRSKLSFNAQTEFSVYERYEILDAAKSGVMPPASYLWLHPGARLKTEDLAVLNDWAEGKLESK
ncbi:MAG: heme-binding domain-containing protein [Bryobacterales bacterium]|nr:heme-binding domain-containing protein [Bryobacterales bacterium]